MGRAENDTNFEAVKSSNILIAYAEDDHDGRVLRNLIASADLIIDALFGIGVRLPIKGDAEKILRNVNQALNAQQIDLNNEIVTGFPEKLPLDKNRPQVLAVDCPSGLDCDTGQVDANTIIADQTVTFIAAKPGLLTFPGAGYVGGLSIATIAVRSDLPEITAIKFTFATHRMINRILPVRSSNSNKGTYGKVLIIAGSVNYSGAPALAAEAAYRSGAGLTTVGAPDSVVNSLSTLLREPTWIILPDEEGCLSEQAAPFILERANGYDAILLGPGWNQKETTGKLLTTLLNNLSQTDIPLSPQNNPPSLIIDADGLNLLAKIDKWHELLPDNAVITPHPGEMARLCGMETMEIQKNRFAIAEAKSQEWDVTLVLKGAHTLVASPDGRLVALPFKTDSLATAGTGDILAGLIAGIIAQGVEPFDAAVIAGYVHGLSGELSAQKYNSGRGVIASDVLDMIPFAYGLIASG
jgi:NAD(P)H-hydrate epimerase